VSAPDSTEIFLCGPSRGTEPAWVPEFENGEPRGPDGLISHIDHVNLTQPWQDFDEAVLFYTSVLALDPDRSTEVAGPRGLVRSQVMRTPDGAVRLPLNVSPLGSPSTTQHVAFACNDVAALARQARDRGLSFLPVPDNYYDDLAAQLGLAHETVAELRELSLLYDRDDTGAFVHGYTRTVGNVFLEIVERRGDYDGYGASNAPVRLAAQAAAAPAAS
jgi:4-hydroxyphenylpyruvate dioxygenase